MSDSHDGVDKLQGILLPNEIQMYFNCGMCLKELPKNTSPSDYARLNVGWTRQGLQVWCTRHDVNVTHLDFMGQKVQSRVIDVKDS